MKINLHTHFIKNTEFSIFNLCIGTKNFNPQNIYFSAGIHPWYILDFDENYLWKEFNYFSLSQNCLAIGEIGFDLTFKSNLQKQKYYFEKQVKLSEELNLPLIIHCVKCFELIFFYRKIYKKTPWIIHDFSGSIEIANQLIKNNIFLSLGNKFLVNSSKIEKILPFLPPDFMFFETDNKFFSIDDVYAKASKILNLADHDLEKIILKNFTNIFKWK